MAYRSTPHESNEFSSNFMVFGKEMYMPVHVILECPDKLSKQEYVQGLRDRLEDAYDVAGEHLQSIASRQKRYYDVKLTRVLMNQRNQCGQ